MVSLTVRPMEYPRRTDIMHKKTATKDRVLANM